MQQKALAPEVLHERLDVLDLEAVEALGAEGGDQVQPDGAFVASGGGGLEVGASVHAVLAKQGVRIAVSDVFGVGGRELLAPAPLDGAYRGRVSSLCRLIDTVDFEIDAVAGPIRARLAGHCGYTAIQAIPGVGPVLAAVFVAEVGEVDRFPGPAQLTSWAELTQRHRDGYRSGVPVPCPMQRSTTAHGGRNHHGGVNGECRPITVGGGAR
ncbi:transposase [Micromonospora echinaurantiaca]|uniref:transposase n=1 Tax=Micromonospora echinaurantiaca TaxID=47857 RepID=UPI00379DE2CE